jgi:glycosyltransferase involved in cell wall biosynthesis
MRAGGVRIAMIGLRGVPATFGGVERHVEELGAALVELGHEVTIYARSNYGEARFDSYRGMRVRHLPSVSRKHLDALVHSLLATGHALSDRPDVVHYHSIGPGLWAIIPRLARRSAVVLTVHGLDHERAKWGSAARTLLTAAAWLSERVPDATILPSMALEEHYRLRRARNPVYVGHGIQPRTRRQPAEITRRFGLAAGSYVLFVGRFVPEKRPDLLIAAFSRLPGEDLRLVLAGGSSFTDDYTERLRRLASADRRVLLPGFVYGSLLDELYSNAAAFVQPSDLEGIPLTLLEAASLGTPIVASDIPGHVEVLERDQPGGHIFPAGDEDALLERLRRALAEPDAERAGADRLRVRLLATYDWGEAARRTEAVYMDVLRARSGSGRQRVGRG